MPKSDRVEYMPGICNILLSSVKADDLTFVLEQFNLVVSDYECEYYIKLPYMYAL